MIIEATARDLSGLLNGVAPRGLRLVSDSVIAPSDVLQMLGNLASEIRVAFAPSAWLIVEDGEVVGLCSVARPPRDGDVHIGYGVAPTRQGRGCATRAIGMLVEWARNDTRVAVISAETGIENFASQKVLERNGFVGIGERADAEDGHVLCWQVATALPVDSFRARLPYR